MFCVAFILLMLVFILGAILIINGDTRASELARAFLAGLIEKTVGRRNETPANLQEHEENPPA